MTKKMLFLMVLFISVVFFGQSTNSLAQTQIPADNTKINKRDRSPDQVTADQQGGNKQDRELTQKIRQAVYNDKSLSTNAHNVKIITVNGVVTLKGPVKSEQEKKVVEELAAQIAGKGNIKSEIGIAP